MQTNREDTLELVDTVVQRLAVADLALALGRIDDAHEAVRAGLATAKGIISHGYGSSNRDLRRSVAALPGAVS